MELADVDLPLVLFAIRSIRVRIEATNDVFLETDREAARVYRLQVGNPGSSSELDGIHIICIQLPFSFELIERGAKSMFCFLFCFVFLAFLRPASNPELIWHIGPDINLPGTWTVRPSTNSMLPIKVSAVD